MLEVESALDLVTHLRALGLQEVLSVSVCTAVHLDCFEIMDFCDSFSVLHDLPQERIFLMKVLVIISNELLRL
jgi:hypothetical protein